jgi:uncharacterized protein (TIGR00255 family)
MKSMTGFGNAECRSETGIIVRVDIVSYNKKQLDLRVLLAKELIALDPLTRKIVSSRVARGAISVRAEVTASDSAVDKHVKINSKLAGAYVEQAKQLKQRLNLSGEIDINQILTLPGVIEELSVEHLLDEKTFVVTLNKALDIFIKMREQEGKVLEKDIRERCKNLIGIINEIEPLSVEIPALHQARLTENMKLAGLEIDLNDERILKEVVVFSDRYDVSEEITRLNSHFLQCEALLSKDEPIGRAFEFLIQEIQREINTLGTKAANSNISPLVLVFKTELEKIREQIQNVE